MIVNFYLTTATIIYLLASGLYKNTWTGWSWSCLRGWWPITKLGMYGILLCCLEWWAFDTTIILAGVLGKDQLAAQSIVLNTNSLLYSAVNSMATATGIRVGWNLGANKPKSAITTCSVGVILCFGGAVCIAVILLSAHNQLPFLFTNDPDVIDLASNLIPFIAIYILLDSVSCVGRAIARGTGMQKVGTIVVLLCFYGVSLPIAIPMMLLTKYELYAAWAAFSLGIGLAAICYGILVFCIFDWPKLARDAQVRAGVQKKDSTEPIIRTCEERTPLIGRRGSCESDKYKSSGQVSDTSESIASNNADMLDTHITQKEIVIKMCIVLGIILVMVIGIAIYFVIPKDSSQHHYKEYTESYNVTS